MNERERDYDERDNELSAAARSLHREWESPGLWPAIVRGMRAQDKETDHTRHWQLRPMDRWQAVAAAAVIALTLAPSSWLGWRWFMLTPKPDPANAQENRERLLTEDALAAIEESEKTYVQAIDELTRLAAPRLDMPDSPLLVNLQERLTVIDAAIAEYRAEIERNRFNAHLRRQLLWIYQEKRRTLEQIQEYTPDAL
jgi:hypothetical protein